MSKLILTRRTLIKSASAVALAAPDGLRQERLGAGQADPDRHLGRQSGRVHPQRTCCPRSRRSSTARCLRQQGSTLGQISQLRASKEAPKFTVMFVDDLGVEIAKREGLIDPLPEGQDAEPREGLSALHLQRRLRRRADDLVGGPVLQHEDRQAARELRRHVGPEVRRRRSRSSPRKNTPSVFMAIATAAIVTGKPYKEAQYLVDQAWPKLAQLKPNVLKLYDTDDAPLQVAQGEGVMGGPEYSKYVYPYQVKGAPIDMSFPKEGAFAGVNCQVFVKGGPNPDLGAAFMNRVLEPKIQQGLAGSHHRGAVGRRHRVQAGHRQDASYPDTKMDQLGLFSPDWAFVNKERPGWIEKMAQIFVS